jgi:hypothetical protein
MKTQDHIDAAFSAALAASAPKAMYGGAATTGLGWALSSEGLAFFGLILTAIGTAVIVWSKIRDDRRAAREERRQELEHEARMRRHYRETELLP